MTYTVLMVTERITITVEPEALAGAKREATARDMSLSAWINELIQNEVKALEGLEAIREYEAEYGPIPKEAREWARRVLDDLLDAQEARRQELRKGA